MERYDCDVLVIGGGGAAGRAAISAARLGASVRMVTKGAFGHSGSSAYKVAEIAGYNVADGQVDPADNPEEHLRDILAAAAGTCDENLARIVAEEAPATLPSCAAWACLSTWTATATWRCWAASPRARGCTL